MTMVEQAAMPEIDILGLSGIEQFRAEQAQRLGLSQAFAEDSLSLYDPQYVTGYEKTMLSQEQHCEELRQAQTFAERHARQVSGDTVTSLAAALHNHSLLFFDSVEWQCGIAQGPINQSEPGKRQFMKMSRDIAARYNAEQSSPEAALAVARETYAAQRIEFGRLAWRKSAKSEAFNDAAIRHRNAYQLVQVAYADGRPATTFQDIVDHGTQELKNLSTAETDLLEDDTSIIGSLKLAFAKTKKRLASTTALLGTTSGMVGRQVTRVAGSGVISIAAFGGVGAVIGGIIGGSKGALTAAASNRLEQIKTTTSGNNLAKDQAAFEAIVGKNGKPDLLFAVTSLHKIAANRTEKDRKANRNRVIMAVGIGAVAGATGGMIDGKLIKQAASHIQHLASLPKPSFDWLPTLPLPSSAAIAVSGRVALRRGKQLAGQAPAHLISGRLQPIRLNQVFAQKNETMQHMLRRVAHNRLGVSVTPRRSRHIAQQMQRRLGRDMFKGQGSTHWQNSNLQPTGPGKLRLNRSSRQMFLRMVARS